MSKEHEKLKKDLNKFGKDLIASTASILDMKSLSNRFPYAPSFDTIHIGIKDNRVSIQGKQDTRVYCYFVIEGNTVTLVSPQYAPKVLSSTRSKEVIKGVQDVKSLFTFYNVTPYEIALEVNADKVAMVANTSQGRVAIVG